MALAEAVAVKGEVMVSIDGIANRVMTTREAFDLVTDLLSAIDRARAYGEHKRGEVAEPDRHRNRKAQR